MLAPEIAAGGPDPSVVLWIFLGVVVIGLPIAAVAFARGAGKGRRDLGGGEFALGDTSDPETDQNAPALVREEARQMIEASNARRLARGEEPLDVDAELERLLSDAHDEDLRAEVRQLVAAHNERRERQGLEPLDVEAEVTRRLSELD